MRKLLNLIKKVVFYSFGILLGFLLGAVVITLAAELIASK
jgi:hypothetical protein